MRGIGIQQEGLFSTPSPESRIPKKHPVRVMVNEALDQLNSQFEAAYARQGDVIREHAQSERLYQPGRLP